MKRFITLLAILCMTFTYIPGVYADPAVKATATPASDKGKQPPVIDAASYILIDSKSGQVLLQRDANVRLYPASTTKILTAVIALEKGNMDKIMTASASAIDDIGVDGMNIGLLPGEEIKQKDLLNALLISSANETANIIAENICPTRKEFMDLMNKKAAALGAINTNFVNPCGAHNDLHYTTASDLAKIARYAMTIAQFREIVASTAYTMQPTNKHDKWPQLFTTNRLIRYPTTYFSPESGIKSLGVKTGYTNPAGNNLVSSAVNKDGVELIAVVMGVRGASSGRVVFNYSRDLLMYGFNNFSIQKLVEANESVRSVPVLDAPNKSTVEIVTAKELKAVLPNDMSAYKLEKKEYINPQIKAPVKEGDVLGSLEYLHEGVSIGKVDLIADNSVQLSVKAKAIDAAKSTVNSSIVKNVIIAFVSAAVLLFALRFTLRRISRNMRMKKKFR